MRVLTGVTAFIGILFGSLWALAIASSELPGGPLPAIGVGLLLGCGVLAFEAYERRGAA